MCIYIYIYIYILYIIYSLVFVDDMMAKDIVDGVILLEISYKLDLIVNH